MNQSSLINRDAAHRRAAEALLRLMVSFARAGGREVGVTASLTLVTLSFCGPLRITELATLEGVSQPSMSGVVSSLERSGLVQRRRDPTDRRVVLVELTPDGARHLERRRESGIQMLSGLLSTLDEADTDVWVAAVPILERVSDQAARLHLGLP